jgi:acyl dehydratase
MVYINSIDKKMSNLNFETDFWKDEKNRKGWDDIIPGEARKTIPYTLTLEAIQKYCKVIGDTHPLYFDEAYAKTTPYKGIIAPPAIHILLMFSCTPADDWMRSPGTINAGQSWSYNIPARPNDVIRLEARALDKFIKKERLFVIHDNVFFNQNNDVICSGRGWTIRPQ